MFNENQGAMGAQSQYQPAGAGNNGYAFQGLNFYNKYVASTGPSNPTATNYTQNSFSLLNNRDTDNNSFIGTSVGGAGQGSMASSTGFTNNYDWQSNSHIHATHGEYDLQSSALPGGRMTHTADHFFSSHK